MLNKQSREEAIQKRDTRDRMQLVDVPPTNPGILKLVIIQLDLKSVNNAMTVDHSKFVTFYYFSSYCCSWQPIILLNQEVHQNARCASSR